MGKSVKLKDCFLDVSDVCGSCIEAMDVSDCNGIKQTGMYRVVGLNHQNFASGATHFMLVLSDPTYARISQVAFMYSEDKIFFRRFDGSWHPWKSITLT